MPNTIHIPTPLRPFTDKQESVQVSGATVGELLADLTQKHDGLRKHLYTDEGKLRNFVNVYLNDEDIRFWAFSYSIGEPCGRSDQVSMYFMDAFLFVAGKVRVKSPSVTPG